MANRHLLRTIAMQTLYEWDFYNKDNKRVDQFIIENIEKSVNKKQEVKEI